LISAGAPLQTPLGELTAAPDPLAGFKEAYFYREERGGALELSASSF